MEPWIGLFKMHKRGGAAELFNPETPSQYDGVLNRQREIVY